MAPLKNGSAIALDTGVTIPPLLFIAIGLGGLTACSPYSAGSFQSFGVNFPEQRATQGCVDIAASASIDPVAEGPVLDLYLGNRCTESVWVDIPSLRMTVYVDDGEEMPVVFYDPKDELKASILGGKEQTMVRLELQAPYESVRVCAQLDRLVSTPDPGPPQILCMPVQGGA